MATYRTCWISDVHLGTKGSKARALLGFIRDHEFEKLYLVGDIIDIWALKRGLFWPQEHNDVIQKLLRKSRKGTELIYIPGNHDEFLSGYHGNFGSIEIRKNDIHQTADGRRILVMHGHELDCVVQNLGWLAHVGDMGYKLLMELNGVVNWMRRKLGRDYWSLSAYVKNEVKNVVSFIGDFEQSVVRYAADHKVDGVLCGHIHHAAIRKMGALDYYNSGDWVESCTALVEHADGRIELLRDLLDVSGDSGKEEAGEDEEPWQETVLPGIPVAA
jgi:UDP-2,3-diacylglucosamine pyrophosphatase LpxH